MQPTPIDIQQIAGMIDQNAEAFERFERLLVEENAKYNLTRITSHQQVRARHWLDSLAALPVLDAVAENAGGLITLLDVGSGAGLPGLPIAIVRPDWTIVSVEATEKKVRFQQMVSKDLKLQNVTVLHARGEDLAHDKKFRGRFDAVTARALASMPVLTELTLAFLRQGGKAVYWKGHDYASELASAQAAIQKMGAAVERVQTYTLTSEEESIEMALIVCAKHKPTPAAYPRAYGVIKKQPLTEVKQNPKGKD
jgi:16S rRNA (guanine527-N7)-methyltransferase